MNSSVGRSSRPPAILLAVSLLGLLCGCMADEEYVILCQDGNDIFVFGDAKVILADPVYGMPLAIVERPRRLVAFGVVPATRFGLLLKRIESVASSRRKSIVAIKLKVVAAVEDQGDDKTTSDQHRSILDRTLRLQDGKMPLLDDDDAYPLILYEMPGRAPWSAQQEQVLAASGILGGRKLLAVTVEAGGDGEGPP